MSLSDEIRAPDFVDRYYNPRLVDEDPMHPAWLDRLIERLRRWR